MYLLNERLRKFFTPIVIIALMSELFFLFSENNELYNFVSSYTVDLLGFCSCIIILLIYVIYPSIKILFKEYGTLIQRIIVILVLISLIIFFPFISVNQSLLLYVFLAIFLNFSSNIEKNGGKYYILSNHIKKNSSDFGEIMNNSSFNVLMIVLLVTIVVGENLSYLDLYSLLTMVLAIVLVISSIIYRKRLSSSFL